MTTEACNICCEQFNKVIRKPTSCPFCEFECCLGCNKQYLLSILGEPHCMSCKRGFLREHMAILFPRSFVDNEYKKHRENLLYEREKCMLPATQTRMEIDDEKQVYTNQIKVNSEARNKLYTEMYNLRYTREPGPNGSRYTIPVMKTLTPEERTREQEILKQITTYNMVINGLRQQKYRVGIAHLGAEQVPETDKEKERRQFIKKCPGADCNGFLSSQWKCSLCGIKVCNKCLEVKTDEKEEMHVCDPENVKTAEMIASETKPCPSCGTRISKLSGCSQHKRLPKMNAHSRR